MVFELKKLALILYDLVSIVDAGNWVLKVIPNSLSCGYHYLEIRKILHWRMHTIVHTRFQRPRESEPITQKRTSTTKNQETVHFSFPSVDNPTIQPDAAQYCLKLHSSSDAMIKSSDLVGGVGKAFISL
jgi:hypothetical protein